MTPCIEIGEVVPGWQLVLVTKTGREAKQGDFGLANGESIEFFWTDEPKEEPCYGCSDEQINALSLEEEIEMQAHFDVVDKLERNFVCRPEVGYKLYAACLKAGYEPDKHGHAMLYWLFHQMGAIYSDWKSKNDVSKTKTKAHI